MPTADQSAITTDLVVETVVGIVSGGGLCPGCKSVIRGPVLELTG